ncbi:DUF7573 domain-containing protein [Haloarchaeobius sp. HRN-SO-5]|uniref:DUF7573 domain-containing protein n=1 Tax=Haloarchaeobius sp. HRN-SO-5 TaxID=3446118 RepID=UPI003EBA458C
MARDASLTEFTGGSSPAETGGDGSPDETESADDETADDETVPEEAESKEGASTVVSTSRLVVDGASCTACGSTVQRTWRDGSDLVCIDCKDW